MYSISARVKIGGVGRTVSSSVVLVAEVFGGVKRHGGEGGRSLTLMSLPCFVRDSSINSEAKGERAACVPAWFGFPHDGNNGNMVVGILVLL